MKSAPRCEPAVLSISDDWGALGSASEQPSLLSRHRFYWIFFFTPRERGEWGQWGADCVGVRCPPSFCQQGFSSVSNPAKTPAARRMASPKAQNTSLRSTPQPHYPPTQQLEWVISVARLWSAKSSSHGWKDYSDSGVFISTFRDSGFTKPAPTQSNRLTDGQTAGGSQYMCIQTALKIRNNSDVSGEKSCWILYLASHWCHEATCGPYRGFTGYAARPGLHINIYQPHNMLKSPKVILWKLRERLRPNNQKLQERFEGALTSSGPCGCDTGSSVNIHWNQWPWVEDQGCRSRTILASRWRSSFQEGCWITEEHHWDKSCMKQRCHRLHNWASINCHSRTENQLLGDSLVCQILQSCTTLSLWS